MMPKFKAWDKSEKKMKRVYSIKFDEQGEAIAIQDEFADNYEICVTYDVKYYELLQSTGLFDKNGTEIYEGDIVTAMSEGYKAIGVVKRRIDGYWLMYPACQNGQSWKLVVNEQGDTDVEIIGNKFEHPNLLGEG